MKDKKVLSELSISDSTSLMNAMHKMDKIGRKLLIIVKNSRFFSLISLGDIQRATVNWNIALKLDPEYNEVRSVLLAIKNNEQIILPE